ncbi:hypothetical protein M2281_000464 [Mesorhizobium soli]|nr:hypothetical protein [Mesorhizobium soli]
MHEAPNGPNDARKGSEPGQAGAPKEQPGFHSMPSTMPYFP